MYLICQITKLSNLFEFDCISSDNYGFGSDGFTFTNCTVDGCKDFELYDYRAITKKGVTNNTYVIVGAGGYEDALRTSTEMTEITIDRNPNFIIPNWIKRFQSDSKMSITLMS